MNNLNSLNYSRYIQDGKISYSYTNTTRQAKAYIASTYLNNVFACT